MNDKGTLIDRRIQQRDAANVSLAEQYGFTVPAQLSLSIEEELVEVTKPERPRPCKKCFGKGTYKPMFFEVECDCCFGVGLDLSAPLALIKQLKFNNEYARKEVIRLRLALHMGATTPEQRQAINMEEFYKDSKSKYRD